jgi:ubiquitin-protein ligase E3 C
MVTTKQEDYKTIEPLAFASGLTVEAYCASISNAFLLFCVCFNHQLTATDDEEFFNESQTLELSSILSLVEFLKTGLRRLYVTHPVIPPETTAASSPVITNNPTNLTQARAKLYRSQQILVCTKLFNSLFARFERRAFTDEDAWQWNVSRLLPDNIETRDESTLPDIDQVSSLYSEYQMALECIPQVIPFAQRLKLFQFLLQMDSRENRSQQFLGGGVHARIRRDQIIQDAFDGLGSIPEKRLKGRIQIEFTSEQGYQEAGIDGGGLFKAFLDAFMKAAFDPIYGLFIPTSEQLLTPNPASVYVMPNHLHYFNFFGKMLGVAMYNVSDWFGVISVCC